MEPRLDIIGAALADPSRVRILCELMDGRAFTNKELACAADISPQTASGHLHQLRAVGLTSSLRSGRCVYHRIANAEVAYALETIASLSPIDHLSRGARQTSERQFARCCYNHLAGHLGVLITERLIAKRVLTLRQEGVSVGPAHRAFCQSLGLRYLAPATGTPAAKLCLDWTERRHHISGPFAIAIMNKCLSEQWLQRQTGSRSLTITDDGRAALRKWFDIKKSDLCL